MARRGRRVARRRRSIAKKRLAATVEDQGFLKTLPGAAADDQIQYNNNGQLASIPEFTWDETDLKINDDTKLKFGTNNDAYIEYNEDGDDFLIISGSSKGMVLSGTTVQIRGTLVGASPLQIAGGVELVSLEGEETTSMKFGDDIQISLGDEGTDDSFLQWKSSGASAGYMILSASTNGIVLSGSAVEIDQKLGIGLSGSSITHAITLPDNADETGRVKANAYMTYSSERFKESIEDINDPMEIVSNLRGVSFTWKKNKERDYGFIAEEVGKELPNIVEWDTPTVENSPRALSMDYTRIVPILLEAIKTQQDQIDNLKSEIKLLKSTD